MASRKAQPASPGEATEVTQAAKQIVFGVGAPYIPRHGPFAGQHFHSEQTYRLAIRSNYAEYRLRVAVGQAVDDGHGGVRFVPGILLGGVPADPEVQAIHLAHSLGLDEDELAAHLRRYLEGSGFFKGLPPLAGLRAAEMIKLVGVGNLDKIGEIAAEAAELRNLARFLAGDDGRICIEGRQVKAGLKEAANTAFAADRWGRTRKGTLSYLAERVFVVEDRIPIAKVVPGYDPLDPDAPLVYLTKEDVADDPRRSPITIRDATGATRSAIAVKEQVVGAILEYTVRIHNDVLDPGQWLEILELAQDQGLGAARSQSFGRFTVVRFDKVAVNVPRRIVYRDLTAGAVAPPDLGDDRDDDPEAGRNSPPPGRADPLLATVGGDD